MENDIYEGFKDFKYDKSHLNEDDDCSVKTDIPSDPWLDDQDINFCTHFLKSKQTTESDNENVSLFYGNELDESNLKEKEIDLYSDLLVIAEEEKISKLKHDSEVENLKKELEKLRAADGDKSMKISELIKENTNLKKSICSLYQTVKSEIEYKDQLLAEANRKLDDILFRKNSQTFRTYKSAETSGFNRFIDTSNQSSHKRKRSEEPHYEKGSEPSLANSKNSNLICDRSTNYASNRNSHKSNCNNSQKFEKNFHQSPVLQIADTFKFSENSRDSTETNNLFFNLIPVPLKKAFYEYEQSQVISLNRLKQSLINEYFTADKHSISNPECIPKRASDKKTFTPNHKNTDSVNSSYSTQNDKAVASNKRNVESNCKITTSMQKDLVSLYKYKKERIPFLDKRKFGLLKEVIIPENLL